MTPRPDPAVAPPMAAAAGEAWLRDRPVADVLAQAAGENFPVAAAFLPRPVGAHLRALYGYARLVDDLGDEAPGDRSAALDVLAADLERVWTTGSPELPVLAALVPTVRACALPPEPFRDLLAANRADQTTTRYATFDELLAYCRLSADPVGRLVLGVFGATTPERVALSDRVCTALQLFEHWQDVGEDYRRGRVYLPGEDLRRFGVTGRDLGEPAAGSALRRLLAFEVGRARDLLDAGTPLVATLRGTARLAVAGFVGGGRAAQEAIVRAGYDVLGRPTVPRRHRVARHALAVLLARASSR
ncbi:MAG TPA: squalene synthase HpnC [Frankiaceae bacterium]|nr:squalene synthase HpnC [Frankiaceae bacterium]